MEFEHTHTRANSFIPNPHIPLGAQPIVMGGFAIGEDPYRCLAAGLIMMRSSESSCKHMLGIRKGSAHITPNTPLTMCDWAQASADAA